MNVQKLCRLVNQQPSYQNINIINLWKGLLYETNNKNIGRISESDRTDFYNYSRKVQRFTNSMNLNSLENVKKKQKCSIDKEELFV